MLSGIIVSVGATILGISVVQLANGYLGTLVSITAAASGFPPLAMGIVLASYFGGYTLGAATLGSLLLRVGHVRLFAALAGLVAACIALQPVFTSPAAWVVIRLVTGMGCAGLFLTAESWLNGSATAENRGRVFSLYMVATNLAFGAGQFLINLPAPHGFELFSLAAALFGLALMPVSLTQAQAPTVGRSPRLGIRALRRLAPVAVAGCAAAGLMGSTFYALIPAYAQTQGIPASSISAYIATAIFGGLAFQIPVGRLSDSFDRRLVAAGVAAGFAVCAVVLAMMPFGAWTMLPVTFLLGGFMSTVYPVCVAHANDRVLPEQVVSTSGSLILINGIASFLGPILGTAIMGRVGVAGVFLYVAAVALLFVGLAMWRFVRVRRVRWKDRPFVPVDPSMGQLAHVADDTEMPPGAVREG
ncbi:MFS transporter [Rhodovarius crocodyli]|uniref:MFS transporter n=1 Tax=Rhodovarius crocodyli TaxID=1979269 RepID=UPI0013E2A16E|nr:MFS transporter [Rhodovarius crocodyli]